MQIAISEDNFPTLVEEINQSLVSKASGVTFLPGTISKTDLRIKHHPVLLLSPWDAKGVEAHGLKVWRANPECRIDCVSSWFVQHLYLLMGTHSCTLLPSYLNTLKNPLLKTEASLCFPEGKKRGKNVVRLSEHN